MSELVARVGRRSVGEEVEDVINEVEDMVDEVGYMEESTRETMALVSSRYVCFGRLWM